jgi:hypothetical protein
MSHEIDRNHWRNRFMKTLVAVVFAFFHFVCVAGAKESFTAHGSTVNFSRPDPANWKVVSDGIDARSNKHLLMYKHIPIKDAEGRYIEPVIAIICESVPDSSDVIMYSIAKRTQTAFNVSKLMTWQDGSLTYKNSVGFDGDYKKGSVIHKVLVAHMRHAAAGLQVICDSTDGVYDKVEKDMRDFLSSITFKE